MPQPPLPLPSTGATIASPEDPSWPLSDGAHFVGTLDDVNLCRHADYPDVMGAIPCNGSDLDARAEACQPAELRSAMQVSPDSGITGYSPGLSSSSVSDAELANCITGRKRINAMVAEGQLELIGEHIAKIGRTRPRSPSPASAPASGLSDRSSSAGAALTRPPPLM